MPIRTYKPTSAGSPVPDGPGVRRDHDGHAAQAAHRAAPQVGRPQQPRRADDLVARRRPQADVPRHRLQAGQARHPREDRHGRVRPEPVGADRARAVRRRREALHPAAERAEGRRHDRRGRPASTSCRATRCRSRTSRSARWSTTWSCGPGKGGQIARSAGSAVQLVAKEGDYATVKMPSGELRKINMECLATIGQVGQPRPRERVDRQGGPQPLARQAAARARRRDEPGRPPARRRRGQDLGRPSPGVAVGHADQGLQDAQPEVDRPVHRAEADRSSSGSRQRAAGSVSRCRAASRSCQLPAANEAYEQITEEGPVRRHAPAREGRGDEPRRARRRSSRPGRAGPPSCRRWSGTRSRCTTAGSSCRST